MIIGACGFGSTGSSVITDYLSEFDNVQVLDKVEFTWVTQPDGLIDLQYHLFQPHSRTGDSIVALRRYKEMAELKERYFCDTVGIDKELYWNSINTFLDDITQIQWPWFIYKNYGFFERLRGKIFRSYVVKNEIKTGIRFKGYPMRMVSYSMMPENFYDAAQKHVKELLVGFGADFSKDIILDQPFAGNNPAVAFPYFENAKAFVVDRDPRDLYCFSKTRLQGRNHFMPTETVEQFVVYYRTLRANQQYTEPNKDVLCLRFEDLVYEYDKTTKLVREFLGYPENPRPKSIFNPELSKANTQVYKRFPQFENDIKYIEKELSEYLFDFDNYAEPDKDAKMFFGKSPLRK